jgi:hypothetical protein
VPAITLDLCQFRAQFPQFDLATITDNTITAQFNAASNYISAQYGSWYSNCNASRQILALYLMTAHLCAISLNIAQGTVAGVLTASTADKVSITLAPPELPNQWQYWLQTTPYGQQLLALLQVASIGGYYAGGRPELAAFRRPGFYY